MANRHLSRSVAMQSLFEWDFSGQDKSKIGSIIKRNVEQFAPGLEDSVFVETIINGVIKKQKNRQRYRKGGSRMAVGTDCRRRQECFENRFV